MATFSQSKKEADHAKEALMVVQLPCKHQNRIRVPAMAQRVDGETNSRSLVPVVIEMISKKRSYVPLA